MGSRRARDQAFSLFPFSVFPFAFLGRQFEWP
jgi:hypothetical protein